MPQIVPVGDFRADVKSVTRYTDSGEVVVLTQNGRPRWAMVDYNEWNAAACERERMIARSILEKEARESSGELQVLTADEWRAPGAATHGAVSMWRWEIIGQTRSARSF